MCDLVAITVQSDAAYGKPWLVVHNSILGHTGFQIPRTPQLHFLFWNAMLRLCRHAVQVEYWHRLIVQIIVLQMACSAGRCHQHYPSKG